MTERKKILIYSLTLCFLATHLICVVKRREWWPFSHYPMYAQLVGVPITFYELKGIPSGDAEREVPIPTEMIGAPRFVRIRVGLVEVVKWVNAGRRGPEVLEEALGEAAGLYNYHRESGNSRIEELGGMRLYRQVWVRAGNPAGSGETSGTAANGQWQLQSREKISEGRCKTPP